MPSREELLERAKKLQSDLGDYEKPVIKDTPEVSALREKARQLRRRLNPKEVDYGTGLVRSALQPYGEEIYSGGVALTEKLTGDRLPGSPKPVEGQGFLDRYRQLRDIERGKIKEFEKKEPVASTFAELAGGIIGVSGLSKLGTKIVPKAIKEYFKRGTPATKTLGTIGTLGAGAATAGIYGVGKGEAETPAGMAKEFAQSAPLGVGGVIAGKAAQKLLRTKPGQKVIEKAKDTGGYLGHGAIKVVTGVDKKFQKEFLKNAAAINNLPELGDLSGHLVDDITKLSDRVVKGSQDATKLIPPLLNFRRNEILAPFAVKIRELQGRRSDEHHRAAEELMRFISRGKQKGAIGGRQLKELLKDLSTSINSKDDRGVFSPVAHRAKLAIYKAINAKLKPKAPAYAKAMEDVSADRQALELAMTTTGKSTFGDQAQAARKVTKLGRQAWQDLGSRELDALAAIDSRLGTNYAKSAKDLITKREFTTDRTRGSRNVNYWSFISSVLGAAIGQSPTGLGTGLAVGATIGATLDKFGGQIAKGILNAYRRIDTIGDNKIVKLLNKYGPSLQNAKTPEAMGLINAQLFNDDPDYRKLVEYFSGDDTQIKDEDK